MTDPTTRVRVRRARASDVPAILRMQRELCALHVVLDPGRFVVPGNIEEVYRNWLARAAEGTDLLAMVCESPEGGEGLLDDGVSGEGEEQRINDGILAYMIAEVMPAHAEYWSPACVYIHDIYVRPGVRSSGVGAQLADQAAAWARSRSITQLRGLIAMGNTAGQAFFQRLGFRLATVEACKELT